jgi:hypothetical protein
MKEDTNCQHTEMLALWKNVENSKINNGSLPHMTRHFLSAFQMRTWHLQLCEIKASYNDPKFRQNYKNNKYVSYMNEGTLSCQLQYPYLFFEPSVMSKNLKVWWLKEVSVPLAWSQRAALNYIFYQNESEWEFLLKAHYKGEREN